MLLLPTIPQFVSFAPNVSTAPKTQEFGVFGWNLGFGISTGVYKRCPLHFMRAMGRAAVYCAFQRQKQRA
jgi:hypothetical protein